VATRDTIADAGPVRFPTTTWTMVSAAGGRSPDAAEALRRLCSLYWPPVYAFIRRKGYGREDAEDLTQAFFTRVLEHGVLAQAQRERGKFRSLVLASVTHFLANERDRSQTLKRGGGCTILSLDFDSAEHKYHLEPADELTPETLFERQWAMSLLDSVLARLCDEYARRGQAREFDVLKAFLTGDEERGAYHEIAALLSTSEGAIRTAVHRLRRRYADLVREAIAETVADRDEVDAEIRFLLAALERA
jgi:RNA polymerase sigma-70 factor (ECF subfamily)